MCGAPPLQPYPPLLSWTSSPSSLLPKCSLLTSHTHSIHVSNGRCHLLAKASPFRMMPAGLPLPAWLPFTAKTIALHAKLLDLPSRMPKETGFDLSLRTQTLIFETLLLGEKVGDMLGSRPYVALLTPLQYQQRWQKSFVCDFFIFPHPLMVPFAQWKGFTFPYVTFIVSLQPN